MWKIVLYIAGVIYTTYVAVMHEETILVTLLLFELIFPFFLFIINLILFFNIKVTLYIPIPIAEKNEETTFYMQVENRFFIPIHRLIATIYIQNTLTHQKIKMRVSGNAASRQTTSFPIQLEGASCGKLSLCIKKVRLYDYMGLFFLTKHCKNTEKEFSILPELYELKINVSEYTREFLVESDAYDSQKSGNDPSEVFQIRDYRDGDRMQAVHWKRSASRDTLMVKEYSRPLGYSVVLLLNQPDAYKGFSYESFFEVFYNLSYALLTEDCKHFIAWFDPVIQDITRMEIKDLQDLYSFLSALLKMSPAHTLNPLSLLYQEKYKGETFSTLLELDSNLLLMKNGIEEFSFDTKHLKEDLTSLTLTV